MLQHVTSLSVAVGYDGHSGMAPLILLAHAQNDWTVVHGKGATEFIAWAVSPT